MANVQWLKSYIIYVYTISFWVSIYIYFSFIIFVYIFNLCLPNKLYIILYYYIIHIVLINQPPPPPREDWQTDMTELCNHTADFSREPLWFRCGHVYECLNLTRVCDGFRDCTDGSDETSDLCNGRYGLLVVYW